MHLFFQHESQFEVVGKIQSNTSYCHIFCDFFDTKKRTYCKHLRYICPDHFKPMKATESEVKKCVTNKKSVNRWYIFACT